MVCWGFLSPGTRRALGGGLAPMTRSVGICSATLICPALCLYILLYIFYLP